MGWKKLEEMMKAETKGPIFRTLSLEDERMRSKLGNLKKKAISASNKFTHSLNKRGKRKMEHMVPSVAIEDVKDAEEESVVLELRQKLAHKDLLPPRHDDYHTLLRFLKAREFNIEKTIHMWEEMLKWRKEFRTDTILEFLEPKSLGRLLDIIEASQLPNFAGGSCTCATDGGCLRSNKGPWNDPAIMKLVHNAEATSARQITRVSKDEHKYNSYVQIRSLKGRISDTSAAESASEIDDQCTLIGQRSSAFACLAPDHEEVNCKVRISGPNAYYSYDDSFPLVEKTVESGQGLLYSPDPLPTSSTVDSQSHQQASFFYWEGI